MVSRKAPSRAPATLPTPATTTAANHVRLLTEVNDDELKALADCASSEPPSPAMKALRENTSSLYQRTLTPSERAAVSESRMAPMARPSRPLRRLRVSTTTAASTTSSKK